MFRSKRQQKQQSRKPLHIRTGDMVLVISGESKSDTPRQVLAVLPKEGKVSVEGVNVMQDRVRIMETRPISKQKNWRVLQIVERAK